MNLETKITIYKFTPQVFTLTRKIYIFIYTGQTRFLREISKYTKKPTNPQYISNVN